MNGYQGQLLVVDLTTAQVTTRSLDPALLRAYLGGSSLSAALLYPYLTRDLDPLGPDNPLLILGGPFTGLAGPAEGRFTVCAKSPATGLWGEHGRGAGRTGMGAVMGSKNLKAVVVRGSRKVPLAREAAFARLRSEANLALRGENVTAILREGGAAGGAEYFDFMGEMPQRYFTSGVFEGASRVSGAVMKETILTGVRTCHACVIA